MDLSKKVEIILIDADKEDNQQNLLNLDLRSENKENKQTETDALTDDFSVKYYDRNRNSLCLDEEDSLSSDMSISSNSSGTILAVSKNFPEFFNKNEPPTKMSNLKRALNDEEKAAQENVDQENEDQEEIPGILEHAKKQKSNEDDEDDDNLSSFDEEDSICSENDDRRDQNVSPNSIKNLLKTDNQLSPIDEFLVNETELQITDQQANENEDLKFKFYDFNENVLDKIFEVISTSNELDKLTVGNIIEKYLNGSTPAFICRYGQHFNGNLNLDLVNKIIADFDRLRNVNNLKYLKRLALSKKNRFNLFGNQLFDQCMTYQSLAKVYFLYYEPTESTTYVNNELSVDLLNGIQLESIQEKVPDNLKVNQEVLYQNMIKMVGDFISKNEKLIEYLYNSDLRPTLRVKIKKKSAVDKYEKYVKMKEIDINSISPVEALELVRAEDSNLIILDFNFIQIENKLLDFLADLYPSASPNFVKDVFDFTWNYYFKSKLVCYYLYELKALSKQLLIDDFQRKLEHLLTRQPLINETILMIEPQGSLFNEKIRYGIQCIGLRISNAYFDFEQKNSTFKSFFINLYKKHQFTLIAITSTYLSLKIYNLIYECMCSEELIQYKYKVKIKIKIVSKNNTLVDECDDPFTRMNFHMDELVDPLRFFAHFKNYLALTDYKYFDLVKPYVQGILDNVLQNSISLVPVDLNYDSLSTLKHVNGLNEELARNIIRHRSENQFINREELLCVEGITHEIYRKCAGFLNINPNTINNFENYKKSFNKYDCTIIHPEFYDDADLILKFMNITKDDLGRNVAFEESRRLLSEMSIKTISIKANVNDFIKTGIILNAFSRPLNFDYRFDIPGKFF